VRGLIPWMNFVNNLCVSEECVDGPSVWYSGNRNYTTSGYPCQRWDV